MNLQLYQSELKEKTTKKETQVSESFQEELLKHGVDTDELSKIESEVSREING